MYRPHCVRYVLTTLVKILPYRPAARLIRANCNTSHDFADNSWIPIDAYLDVVLKDLPWRSNLTSNQSIEYKNLVKEFNDTVCICI